MKNKYYKKYMSHRISSHLDINKLQNQQARRLLPLLNFQKLRKTEIMRSF